MYILCDFEYDINQRTYINHKFKVDNSDLFLYVILYEI